MSDNSMYTSATVSGMANSNALAINGITGGTMDNCLGGYQNYWDTYYHYYQTYPIYQYVDNKNKVEQAFKIMQKLIELKIIDKISLQTFIETVNKIADVL